jgi:1-acylglycerone phosphate reductase
MTQVKTILVTGCSDGGIGSSLALELQKRDHRVFAAVRNPSKASTLSSLPNIVIITLDVTSKDSIANAVETIQEQTGGRGLDVLINNAGGGVPTTPLVEADLDAGRRMFDVNFWGVLSMAQAFTPLLIQARGTIVNICSVGAIMHTPYLGLYDSSKAAITMASETMRLELKPLSVNVITAMVGMVESKFHDNLAEPQLREGSIYKPAEKWIKLSSTPGQGNLSQYEMPLGKFSANMVDDILAGKSGKVWRGGFSTVSRISQWLLPSWVLVRLLYAQFDKLHKLMSAFRTLRSLVDEDSINYRDYCDQYRQEKIEPYILTLLERLSVESRDAITMAPL